MRRTAPGQKVRLERGLRRFQRKHGASLRGEKQPTGHRPVAIACGLQYFCLQPERRAGIFERASRRSQGLLGQIRVPQRFHGQKSLARVGLPVFKARLKSAGDAIAAFVGQIQSAQGAAETPSDHVIPAPQVAETQVLLLFEVSHLLLVHGVPLFAHLLLRPVQSWDSGLPIQTECKFQT